MKTIGWPNHSMDDGHPPWLSLGLMCQQRPVLSAPPHYCTSLSPQHSSFIPTLVAHSHLPLTAAATARRFSLSPLHSPNSPRPSPLLPLSLSTPPTPTSFLPSYMFAAARSRLPNNALKLIPTTAGARIPSTTLLPSISTLVHSSCLNPSPPSYLSLRHASSQSYTTPPPSPTASHSARSVIIKLLQNIGSRSEVEQYLKFYSAIDTPKFAVIKVGGGIINDELDVLASSLSFLADVGLLPVVIHGAGPQLNDALKKQGIVSDYIGGMRITTPEILRTARQVFLEANLKIVKALEDKGTRARPIVSGVFAAEFLDQAAYQYVGQITGVDISSVHHALASGSVPVLTCMGESMSGQRLNINADVAAQELAKALRPVKIIYLSQNGGIGDEKDQLMPLIDLDTDYERLMVQPWFRHGNRLKLKEIKTLLDQLPMSSSVAITSAANLPKELFTHRGSGTLVKRSEKDPVLHFTERDRQGEADGPHRDLLRRPPADGLPRPAEAAHPPHLPQRLVQGHRHHHEGQERP